MTSPRSLVNAPIQQLTLPDGFQPHRLHTFVQIPESYDVTDAYNRIFRRIWKNTPKAAVKYNNTFAWIECIGPDNNIVEVDMRLTDDRQILIEQSVHSDIIPVDDAYDEIFKQIMKGVPTFWDSLPVRIFQYPEPDFTLPFITYVSTVFPVVQTYASVFRKVWENVQKFAGVKIVEKRKEKYCYIEYMDKQINIWSIVPNVIAVQLKAADGEAARELFDAIKSGLNSIY